MSNPNFPSDTKQNTVIDLDVTRVALCNTGANARADIIFMKRKEQNTMPKFTTFEELVAELEPAAAELVSKHVTTQLAEKETAITAAKAALDASQQELEAAKKELETAKAAKATVGPATTQPASTPEDAIKSLPAEVQKALKEQREQLEELVAKDRAREAEQRYEAVKAIPVEAEQLKAVVAAISPAGFEVLKSAAAAITANVVTEPAGSDAAGTVSGDAYAQLEQKAKQIATAKSITFETAFTEACAENPALYAQL